MNVRTSGQDCPATTVDRPGRDVLLGLRHLAAASATTFLLATLTACGSGGTPEGPLAEGSKSASPSADASTEPTPPPVPEAAEDTEKGRKAFARWFVSAFAYAFATNDPGPIMDVASQERPVQCDTCAAFAEYLEEREADDGLVVEPSRYEVTKVFNTGRAMEDVWAYTLLTKRPAYANVTEDGEVRDRQEADPSYQIDVGLRWGDDGYEITGWIAGKKKEQEDR
jgi:hypothetical protein